MVGYVPGMSTPHRTRTRRRAVTATGAAALAALALAGTAQAGGVGATSTTWSVKTIGPTGESPADVAIDPAGNVWTANEGSDSVTRISPSGAVTNFGPTGSRPQNIAIDSQGNVYTANYMSDSVSRISASGQVTTTWAQVGQRPTGIAVDSAGRVYTANYLSRGVTRVNADGTASGTAPNWQWGPGTGNPADLAVDSSGVVYLLESTPNQATDGYITRIAPDGSLVPRWGLAMGVPSGIAVDSTGTAFVSNFFDNTLSLVTAAGASTRYWARTGDKPSDVAAFSLGGARKVVTVNLWADSLSLFDVATRTSTTLEPTGRRPTAVAVGSEGAVYVPASLINGVTVFTPCIAGAAAKGANAREHGGVCATAPTPKVTWSVARAKGATRTVTATFRRATGTRYALSAASNTRLRRGECRMARFDFRCTVTLPRGTWRAAVTPRKSGTQGLAAGRTVVVN